MKNNKLMQEMEIFQFKDNMDIIEVQDDGKGLKIIKYDQQIKY